MDMFGNSLSITCGDGLFTFEEIAILCGFEGTFEGNISTKFD